MSRVKPLHYRGNYLVRARNVRNLANLDPRTVCWRCGTGKPRAKRPGSDQNANANKNGEGSCRQLHGRCLQIVA